MIPVILYLVKDTFKRWAEQPWSPLARALVALFVSVVALIVLGIFEATERGIEERMRKLGVNTVLTTRQLAGGACAEGERYAWLQGQGTLLVLGRPYLEGKCRAGLTVEIHGYAPASLTALAAISDSPALLVTATMPEGIEERVVCGNGLTLDAKTVSPRGFLRLLPIPSNGAVLLVPLETVAAQIRAAGGVETLVFERNEMATLSLNKCVDTLSCLSRVDGLKLSISSAMKLRKELDDVRGTKRIWTGILCFVFGGLLVLVFGAMAALEYRESRFLAALLRSMGARSWLLVGRQAMESVVVVNVGGISAVAVLRLAVRHADWFSGLGVDIGKMGFADASIFAVFAGLSAGAIVAALPVAVAIRKPIGVVLG